MCGTSLGTKGSPKWRRQRWERGGSLIGEITKSHKNSLRWNFGIPALCLPPPQTPRPFWLSLGKKHEHQWCENTQLKILTGLDIPECLNSKDWVTYNKGGSLRRAWGSLLHWLCPAGVCCRVYALNQLGKGNIMMRVGCWRPTWFD